jgi:hypothetical protein
MTYLSVIQDHTDGNGSTNDVLLKAAINVTNAAEIVVTHTNAALNGYTATVYIKPVSAASAVVLNTAMWSTQTIIFDNGCEGPTSLTASADVAVDYTLGSSAVTSTWADYTPVFPAGVATPDPMCAWLYTATNA